MIKGFDAIVGENPRVLILGSMPSVVSLEKQEYYGYRHNRFWKIISQYFHEHLSIYEDKKACLKKHHIALWDVIQSCEREGSLDSAIQHEVCNDIEGFIKVHPSIEYILCNGKKSYALYQKHFSFLKVECIALPSTSNANRTIKEEELFRKWYSVLDEIMKKGKMS